MLVLKVKYVSEVSEVICHTYQFDFFNKRKKYFMEYLDGLWVKRREPKEWTRL